MMPKADHRIMPAVIAAAFIAIFAVVMLTPMFKPDVEFDESMKQTLLTLTVAAVMFYIGTSQGSAKKDETIAAQVANANNSATPVLTVSPTVAVAPEAAVTITPPKETP
jgi:hypothetical protein